MGIAAAKLPDPSTKQRAYPVHQRHHGQPSDVLQIVESPRMKPMPVVEPVRLEILHVGVEHQKRAAFASGLRSSGEALITFRSRDQDPGPHTEQPVPGRPFWSYFNRLICP